MLLVIKIWVRFKFNFQTLKINIKCEMSVNYLNFYFLCPTLLQIYFYLTLNEFLMEKKSDTGHVQK